MTLITGRYTCFLKQPDYDDDVCELSRAATADSPEVRIPLVYDYCGKGGWHLYFIPTQAADEEDLTLLARHIEDMVKEKGPEAYQRLRRRYYNLS